ncbi:helix-turn-helix transcriptional regulator, partial [Clostridium botulinum]|nr:helix-turn-helix transcriptional regulator [Clostridium botulinum]
MAISNVGNRIKALRKEHNYTLKDLSFKTNISVSFLSDIE